MSVVIHITDSCEETHGIFQHSATLNTKLDFSTNVIFLLYGTTDSDFILLMPVVLSVLSLYSYLFELLSLCSLIACPAICHVFGVFAF